MVLIDDTRELEHASSLGFNAFAKELVGLVDVILGAENVSDSALSRCVYQLVRLEAFIDLILLQWVADRLEIINLKDMSA